jgi:hypothetical protein
MKPTHYNHLPHLGDDDLVFFRDAAITYAACQRQRGLLRLEASAEAWDLLQWLGIEGTAEGASEGIAYLDPSRNADEPAVQVRVLPSWQGPGLSLESFRQQGYVPEAMFATLIRSSYGPDRLDFFPTRSELGFYFEESLLLSGTSRWDQDYLAACQAFFMEELTPAELLANSMALWPVAQRQSAVVQTQVERWENELHGVTFLVASELETLRPLADLLAALLALDSPVPGLHELVSGVASWDVASWSAAWASLPQEHRQQLSEQLCPGFAAQAEAILYAAGPEFLLWRATSPSEAVQ